MYYPSNYASVVDVEVHSDETSYCASFVQQHGGSKMTKAQIIEASNTGKNLLA